MTEEDVDGDEFNELERKALRRIMNKQRSMEFLWATLRIWSGWITAIVVSTYAAYEAVAKLFFHKG